MIGQLLLGFSLLIGMHEFGHFFFAKLFGIRVTKFYIFFDFFFPLTSVARFSLLKKKVGDTEYGIGWFPLGGYVQIHGMIDETQGAAALAGPPQPDEFRAKPAWQRLLVMLGGILVNVTLSIGIFATLAYVSGVSYLPAREVQADGVLTSSLGRRIGLRDGDRVVALNGQPLTEFEQLYDPEVLGRQGTYFTVERHGQQLSLPPLPATFFGELTQTHDTAYVAVRKPFFLQVITAGDSAAVAGLRSGDHIRLLNGLPVRYFDEFQRGTLANRGGHVSLVVERAGQLLPVRVGVNSAGKVGVVVQFEVPTRTRPYSLAEALPQGLRQAVGVVRVQAVGLSKLVRREIPASASLAGPVEIAQQFGGTWDWRHFWELTATLSMVVAFMNLLPVPALDGGHALFLLYEMISRRKPSVEFLHRTQRLGTLLLLSLMMYVLVVKQLMKLFPG